MSFKADLSTEEAVYQIGTYWTGEMDPPETKFCTVNVYPNYLYLCFFLQIDLINKECENEKKTAKEEFEVLRTFIGWFFGWVGALVDGLHGWIRWSDGWLVAWLVCWCVSRFVDTILV